MVEQNCGTLNLWSLSCVSILGTLPRPLSYVLTHSQEPVRACLTHRHAYVRKNATFAIASIFTHLPELLPDAPDLLVTFLDDENDATCKRNAFAALASI